MKTSREFEERVYELYELKKKKRAGAIKKFTVAATTLVAAACIVLVFTRFNRKIENPPTQGETFAESATMVGADEGSNPTGDLEMGTPELNWPEGDVSDGMDGMNGIPENSLEIVAIGCIESITSFPLCETVSLEKEDGDVLYVRLYNADVEEDVDYECGEEYYHFEGWDYENEISFVYSEGRVKLSEGEWMRLDESTEEYVEEIIKELFE